VVLVVDDLIGDLVIDPRDYADAIAKAIPAKVTAVAMRETRGGVEISAVYEVRIGDRIVARLPKDEAISFLDGVCAGVNLGRGASSP